MKILKSIQRIPGGLMVIPLLLGATINTFFPQALEIGGFTTGLFKNGSSALLGLFLLCNGAQINVKAAPKALLKGTILTVVKYAIGAAIGLATGAVFGKVGILGLTPLAIIAAMTNSNGGLYVALASEFGDETDVGAVSVLSINDGPFLTMVALGASGLASIPFMSLVAVLVPIVLGMILGNLDEDLRKFLAQGTNLLIPFFAFPLGAAMDFRTIFTAGGAGVLLGLATVLLTGFGGYFVMRLFKFDTAAGAAEGSTAGNAVGTPAAVAAVDPTWAPFVQVAAAQVAASTLVTAFLCPLLVVWIDRHLVKHAKQEEAATVVA